MRPLALVSVTRAMLVGLDALLVALVVVAVVISDSAGRPWPTVLAAVSFLVVYGWGRLTIRVHTLQVTAPRGQWWPAGAWVTALLVLWVPLLLTSRGALWLAFPLMLLQMHFLGPRRGVAAVAVTTAAAAVNGVLGAGDWPASIGFVLGPAIGAAVAVGVSLGLEALARLYQQRDQALQELSAAREHLAAARLEAAVAGERSRLAREIHDTLAQGFSGIELLLRTAEPQIGEDDAMARRHVSRARETARQNLGEARRFVQALSPGDLQGVTLAAALQRLADRVALASGVEVRVSVSGQPRSLSVPVETALLRVAQSALGNVIEHSGATRADVTLSFLHQVPGREAVVLDVVDDGSGFDPLCLRPGPGRGFGISGMRARVEELGGSLAIESTAGEGTAVAARVPLQDDSKTGYDTQVQRTEVT